MRGISEERLKQILHNHVLTHKTQSFVQYLIANECQELQEPWMTLDEFLDSGFEGLCWVCYENKFVYEGIYSKKDNYFYHEFETTFDYEDVTHVQPIYKPEAPV